MWNLKIVKHIVFLLWICERVISSGILFAKYRLIYFYKHWQEPLLYWSTKVNYLSLKYCIQRSNVQTVVFLNVYIYIIYSFCWKDYCQFIFHRKSEYDTQLCCSFFIYLFFVINYSAPLILVFFSPFHPAAARKLYLN